LTVYLSQSVICVRLPLFGISIAKKPMIFVEKRILAEAYQDKVESDKTSRMQVQRSATRSNPKRFQAESQNGAARERRPKNSK
jgi:hypothetical protein